MVQPRWENNKSKDLKGIIPDQRLYLTDANGARTEMQQCKVDSGQMALGLAFSPSGNTKDEVTRLRNKADIWAEHVRTGHLSRSDAWQCLKTTVMKTIEYSLPASILSAKDFDSILVPVLRVGLPKSGICRTISRAVTFGSIGYQGLGIQHPFYLQGIYKIQLLLDNYQPLTHQLFQVSWTRASQESGMGDDFLNNDYNKIKNILTKGWITALWEFLTAAKGVQFRRIDGGLKRELRHTEDQYLMRMVMDKGDVLGDELQLFNNCRVYIQAELLSDIVTADGKAICKEIWTGKATTQRSNILEWVTNPRPTEKAWKIWRRVLQQILNTNQDGKLQIHLPKIKCTDDWMWRYHEATNRLYQTTSHGTWEYTLHREGRIHNTRRKAFRLQGQVDSTPQGIIAATVFIKGNTYIIDGLGASQKEKDQPIHHIDDYIRTTQTGEDDIYTDALMQNKLMIMSDGSEKDLDGAAAWVITTEELFQENQYIQGQVEIPKCKCDSYRAECFGIYGGIFSLLKVINNTNLSPAQLKQITVHIGCDNVSAIQHSLDTLKYPSIKSTDSDYDILTAIRDILPKDIKIIWKHVKGHQSGDNIDIWGRLNNLADSLAGTHRENLHEDIPNSDASLPGEKWQVIINDKKIYKQLKTSIYNQISRDTLVPYWIKKGRFSQDGADDINWEALAKAMQQSSSSQRQWITKRAARECGANYVLHQRKQKDNDSCALCGQMETVLHIITCQETRATQQWEKSIDEFRIWMTQNDTDPKIMRQLCDGLTQWRNTGQVIQTNSDDELLLHQNAIGWNSVLEGCFNTEWEKSQHLYFHENKSRRSGLKWQIQVCRRIWMIPWAMWQHRNTIEHESDAQKALSRINNDIDNEIEFGSGNITEIENMISETRLTEFQNRTMAYKKGWLKGVRAMRERTKRRELNSQALAGMRENMRNFLAQNN